MILPGRLTALLLDGKDFGAASDAVWLQAIPSRTALDRKQVYLCISNKVGSSALGRFRMERAF
jgi:hypothetical protein